MSKRFFTKINKKGRNVIIDKECHTELFDLTLACDVLNRLDLKLKHYNEINGEQQDKITELEKNFEDLVNWSSEIAKRNVVLDEKIGRLQKELNDCEKFRYTTFKRMRDVLDE